MKQLLLLPILLLGACATNQRTPEPIITTVEVPVPVAQPCVPESLQRDPPVYTDNDAAMRAVTDIAVRYQMLWAGRAERMARLNLLEPVVAACPRGSSTPDTPAPTPRP
jgi:hypothetical protein